MYSREIWQREREREMSLVDYASSSDEENEEKQETVNPPPTHPNPARSPPTQYLSFTLAPFNYSVLYYYYFVSFCCLSI